MRPLYYAALKQIKCVCSPDKFPTLLLLFTDLFCIFSGFILSEIDGHLIQGRRIKNHYPVKVLINIFHPTQLLAFLDSYFL